MVLECLPEGVELVHFCISGVKMGVRRIRLIPIMVALRSDINRPDKVATVPTAIPMIFMTGGPLG